jgi:hypothetical protein
LPNNVGFDELKTSLSAYISNLDEKNFEMSIFLISQLEDQFIKRKSLTSKLFLGKLMLNLLFFVPFQILDECLESCNHIFDSIISNEQQQNNGQKFETPTANIRKNDENKESQTNEINLQIRYQLLEQMRDILMENFDFTRKQKCFDWYLSKLHQSNLLAKL